jgi:phosphoenolpyruvate carboxylase
MIREEYERTLKNVMLIAEQSYLLEATPSLALSLSRRDPYLDPLSHIQILLLKRYRAAEDNEDEQLHWLNPLLRTINAVAAGMRNTG